MTRWSTVHYASGALPALTFDDLERGSRSRDVGQAVVVLRLREHLHGARRDPEVGRCRRHGAVPAVAGADVDGVTRPRGLDVDLLRLRVDDSALRPAVR